MPVIKTFQDGTNLGVFCQLNFEDGRKVLLSFTATEFAVFKVGFMGMTGGKLFGTPLFDFINSLEVEVGHRVDSFPGGKNSPLKKVVNLAMKCKSLEDLLKKLEEITTKK